MSVQLQGIEELRTLVKAYDYQSEGFNLAYSTEELLAIFRAHRACEWDFYPDQWEPRQVDDAINGAIVPRWREVKGEPRPWYPRKHIYVSDFRKGLK